MRNKEANREGFTVYELGYLILPSIPEDKLGDVVSLIRNVITAQEGIEIDAEAPIKQDLAYSMSKVIGASRYVVSDAYLGWIKFEAEPAKIGAIKDRVEKMGEVLRFLLIKAPRETTFTLAKAAKAREVVEERPEPTTVPVEEAVVN
jgi:ribosomal protein S6